MNRYDSYKDSGVEWIGEIPNIWKTVQIKRLCSVKRGSSPRPIDDPKYFHDNGEFSWVRISDVSKSERYLEKTKETLSELGSTLSTKILPNDIFLSIAGSVGKPIITKIKCCIHDGFVWFDGLNYDKELLYYIFSLGKCFSGLGKMGTQLNLNTESVGMINIPLIPLSEQQQIVSFLDDKTQKIDSLIQQKEKKIELLKEKRTSLINHVVTKGLDSNVEMKDSGVEWIGEIPNHWDFIPLKRIVKICNGKDYKHIEVEEGGYPVFGTGGEFSRCSDFLYKGPSVGLGRKGTIDKPMFIDEPFWTSDTLYYTEIGDKVLPIYFYFLVKQIPFSLYKNGGIIPSMTKTDYEEMRFPLPEIVEQQQIVEYLDKQTEEIDTLIQLEQKKIDTLKEYRQSLISEVVTGKIKVV